MQAMQQVTAMQQAQVARAMQQYQAQQQAQHAAAAQMQAQMEQIMQVQQQPQHVQRLPHAHQPQYEQPAAHAVAGPHGVAQGGGVSQHQQTLYQQYLFQHAQQAQQAALLALGGGAGGPPSASVVYVSALPQHQGHGHAPPVHAAAAPGHSVQHQQLPPPLQPPPLALRPHATTYAPAYGAPPAPSYLHQHQHHTPFASADSAGGLATPPGVVAAVLPHVASSGQIAGSDLGGGRGGGGSGSGGVGGGGGGGPGMGLQHHAAGGFVAVSAPASEDGRAAGTLSPSLLGEVISV
jgi:hypothetical protein